MSRHSRTPPLIKRAIRQTLTRSEKGDKHMTTSSNEQGEPHVGNNEPPTEPQTPAVESTTASVEPLYCSVGEPLNKTFMKRVPAGSLEDAVRAMMLEQQ